MVHVLHAFEFCLGEFEGICSRKEMLKTKGCQQLNFTSITQIALELHVQT